MNLSIAFNYLMVIGFTNTISSVILAIFWGEKEKTVCFILYGIGVAALFLATTVHVLLKKRGK